MKLGKGNSTTGLLLLLALLVLLGLQFVLFKETNLEKLAQKTKKEEVKPVFVQNTDLNLLEITLEEKDYLTLKKYRDKAIVEGVIQSSKKKYVPATITYNGKEYRAQVRLKGDWTDHLKTEKWSFRVKLKGDNTILGMRKFSIHHPETRGYINEWLFHKAAKDENLIGLRYEFLEGGLHIKKEDESGYTTKNLGIYAIEETFDKRMIENNKRKESILLKFDEENWWKDVKKRIDVGSSSGTRWDKFSSIKGNWKYPVVAFSEEKVLSDTLFSSYYDLSKNLINDFRANKYKLSDIFNTKQMAMHSVLTNLFGAQHGTSIINIRYYYNPMISKLEPIAFDGNSGHKITEYHHFIFAKEERDSSYYRALIKAIDIVSKERYLDNVIEKYSNKLDFYEVYLDSEFDKPELLTENLRANQQILIQERERLVSIFGNPEEEVKVIKEIPKTEKANWEFTNMDFSEMNQSFLNQDVFHLQRNSSTEAAYVKTGTHDNFLNETLTVSYTVKATSSKSNFAIRMQGAFPNRSDAVFNINNGKVIGVNEIGTFTNSKAEITDLGNGWYKCTLAVHSSETLIKAFIGACSSNKPIRNWESKEEETQGVYIAQ